MTSRQERERGLPNKRRNSGGCQIFCISQLPNESRGERESENFADVIYGSPLLYSPFRKEGRLFMSRGGVVNWGKIGIGDGR